MRGGYIASKIYELIERLLERISFSPLVPKWKDDAFDLG